MGLRDFPAARVASDVSIDEDDSLDLLGVSEVAKLVHQTPKWVRSQTRSRLADPMPHIKAGRRLFFEEKLVVAWFRARRFKKRAPQKGR
jgi:hypothetical protein